MLAYIPYMDPMGNLLFTCLLQLLGYRLFSEPGQECGAHLCDWSLAERYAESASPISLPFFFRGNVGILASGIW